MNNSKDLLPKILGVIPMIPVLEGLIYDKFLPYDNGKQVHNLS